VRKGVALIVAVLLAASAPLVRAQSPADIGPVRTRTLANGLRVVAVEDDAVAVVATTLWVRFGAADEPAGELGLAHALARMLFLGTPALSSAGFDDVTARLGARASVTTASDYTAYALTVPADKLELALRIDADRFQHGSLGSAAWTAEQRVLEAENGATPAEPLARLYRDVCRAASSTPLCATAALGAPRDIAALRSAELRAAYRDWYVPANATLVIAGDVRADDVFRLADGVFGGIGTNAPPAHVASAPQYASGAEVDSRDPAGGGGALDFAYAAPGTNDERAGAFAVLDAALGSRRSELSRTLIDGGFADSFATRWDRSARGGLYHVFVFVARNHASASVRAAFLDALGRTRDGGLGSDLVQAAKTSLVRSAEDAGDSLEGIARHVGYAVAVENVGGPGVDLQRIDAASVADVAAAARIFLQAPAATGVLAASGWSDDGPLALPPSSLDDDFSRRVPTGKVIEAAWVRRALAQRVAIPSNVRPAALTLGNGLRVLVQPVHANPTVFVSGTVETSRRFDARGREGTGAMLSELLAAGGAKYGVAARGAVADALGARFDFGLTFRAHGAARDLRALLDVLADALAAPTLSGDDVETVRRALRARNRKPGLDALADRAFGRLLLRRDDPALREPNDATLRAITVEDLRAYARRFVRPDLTTLAIVGDIDAASVRADVEGTFGDWPRTGRTPGVGSEPYAPAHAARAAVGQQRERVVARFGLPVGASGSRDYAALVLLREILAAQRYPPSATALAADRFRGLLELRLTASPAQLPKAARALRRELSGLHHPVTATQLSRAQATAVAGPLVAEQATFALAERVREIGVNRLPLDVETLLPEQLERLRAEDVARVARTYLHPAALIEVDEGPGP
jgi:zinc protease